MIEFKFGDILAEDADALVNTVNCVGVMGRGVALQFKNAFPENFKAYKSACDRGAMRPGRMFVFESERLTKPRYIINFPTKRHWRGKSRIEDIESGLEALVKVIEERGIESIAIPPLGSGLGGLDWKVVRARIVKLLGDLGSVRIAVFEPGPTSEAQGFTSSRVVPAMTSGRAALVGLVHRYLGALLDPFVSLLEVHKLMYFMQQAGEPLRLRFRKASQGPYAENLRHVLNAIEGHYLVGYSDGGDAPTKQLTLVPGAVDDADMFLKEQTDTRLRFDRVVELVQGFETPFGLELLSTVHWVAIQGDCQSVDDVIAQTYAWNRRKKRFSPRQIRLALSALARNGWTGAAFADNVDPD
ncbi:MAG: macro domain-containing protein [Alphaproteobacteria bacterium]